MTRFVFIYTAFHILTPLYRLSNSQMLQPKSLILLTITSETSAVLNGPIARFFMTQRSMPRPSPEQGQEAE